jgi:hypothetical protein
MTRSGKIHDAPNFVASPLMLAALGRQGPAIQPYGKGQAAAKIVYPLAQTFSFDGV